jgi:phosphoribosylpyrophosphate synthetase
MTVSTEDSAIHIPNSFREYHPKLALLLEKEFPLLHFQDATHENLMPLVLSEEVPHAVMLWLMNGDNWKDALADMFNAHVMTQDLDEAGSNVQRLGVFAPFVDFRQDRRTVKPRPGTNGKEMGIVKAQGSWTVALANLMRYVAKVDYFAHVDGHSHLATTHLEQVGIDVVNITTAHATIAELQARKVIDNKLDNVICGVDFGNLALVKNVSETYGYSVAIIRKWREAINGGIRSKTTHELVFGDVRGKRVILMDDMIGSGGTLVNTVDLLLTKGAAEVVVSASHAVFSGREYYDQVQQLLKYDKVKLVMTTDTLPLRRPGYGGDKSLPYILEPGQAIDTPHPKKKQVEMLPASDLMGRVLVAMLRSKNVEEIRRSLGQEVVIQRDPYELFEEMTGQKVERPINTAIYRPGGYFEPLAKKS